MQERDSILKRGVKVAIMTVFDIEVAE